MDASSSNRITFTKLSCSPWAQLLGLNRMGERTDFLGSHPPAGAAIPWPEAMLATA